MPNFVPPVESLRVHLHNVFSLPASSMPVTGKQVVKTLQGMSKHLCSQEELGLPIEKWNGLSRKAACCSYALPCLHSSRSGKSQIHPLWRGSWVQTRKIPVKKKCDGFHDLKNFDSIKIQVCLSVQIQGKEQSLFVPGSSPSTSDDAGDHCHLGHCALFFSIKRLICVTENPSSRTHTRSLTLMPWVYTGKSFPKVMGEKLLKDNWVFLVCPPERGHTAACHWSIPTLALRCITTSPLGLLMHHALSTIAVDFDSRNSMKTTESKLQLKRNALPIHTPQ